MMKCGEHKNALRQEHVVRIVINRSLESRARKKSRTSAVWHIQFIWDLIDFVWVGALWTIICVRCFVVAHSLELLNELVLAFFELLRIASNAVKVNKRVFVISAFWFSNAIYWSKRPLCCLPVAVGSRDFINPIEKNEDMCFRLRESFVCRCRRCIWIRWRRFPSLFQIGKINRSH